MLVVSIAVGVGFSSVLGTLRMTRGWRVQMLAVSASQTMLENEDTSGLHRFTIQRSWCNLFQCPLEKVAFWYQYLLTKPLILMSQRASDRPPQTLATHHWVLKLT